MLKKMIIVIFLMTPLVLKCQGLLERLLREEKINLLKYRDICNLNKELVIQQEAKIHILEKVNIFQKDVIKADIVIKDNYKKIMLEKDNQIRSLIMELQEQKKWKEVYMWSGGVVASVLCILFIIR